MEKHEPYHYNHPKIRIKETGEEFRTYGDVAKRINGNKGCVYLCLQGMRKKHRGFSFEYVRRKK